MTQVAQAFDSIDQRVNAELRSLDVAQWKYLVSRIDEPDTAKIIVEYLDDDPSARARVGAIYMRARYTIQRSRTGHVRRRWSQMVGRSVRWIFPSARRHRFAPAAEAHPHDSGYPAGESLVWPELRPELLSAKA